MKRLIVTAGGTAAVLALAACGGSTPTSSTSNGTSGSSNSSTNRTGNGAGLAGRRGTAGQLVQINGTSLVLSTTSGTDVTVNYTGTTPITQTKTGALADIVPGGCITATGTKDSSGTLIASSVRYSQPVNGSCTAGFGGGNRPPGAGTGTGATPQGTPRPRPTLAPGQQPPAFATGKVTAVNGTAITLQPATGAAQTITVPTTVTVSESSSVPASTLETGDCISATGSKDSSGNVTATSLSIVPAGPSGCFTGGGGGFGGFGGRGFGGGGFGGGGFGGAGGAGGTGGTGGTTGA